MFVDYYKILEINNTATSQEIRTSFRKQCVKWHPDKNLNFDTTENMQAINEAYLILKDVEARNKYDVEWEFHNEYLNNNDININEDDLENDTNFEKEYQFKDEVLEKWMNTAKKQSVDLAQQAIKDFKNIAKEGVKGSLRYVFYQIIVIVVSFLIFKTCNS